MSFNFVGLKNLIYMCYASSPVVYIQMSFFGEDEVMETFEDNHKPYKMEITEKLQTRTVTATPARMSA